MKRWARSTVNWVDGLLLNSVAAARELGRSGGWTKGGWRSKVRMTICGEPVSGMGRCGIAWDSGGATSGPSEVLAPAPQRVVRRAARDGPRQPHKRRSCQARSCWVWSLSNLGMGTTGRRAHIGRHGSEREVCSALAQLALPTGSSPPLDPLPNTSVRASTDAPFLPMVRRDRAESRAGERPQVSTGRLRETGNEAL